MFLGQGPKVVGQSAKIQEENVVEVLDATTSNRSAIFLQTPTSRKGNMSIIHASFRRRNGCISRARWTPCRDMCPPPRRRSRRAVNMWWNEEVAANAASASRPAAGNGCRQSHVTGGRRYGSRRHEPSGGRLVGQITSPRQSHYALNYSVLSACRTQVDGIRIPWKRGDSNAFGALTSLARPATTCVL